MKLRIGRRCVLLHPSEEIVAQYCFQQQELGPQGMSCPSWQWHRTGSRWFPVRTLPVAPLWCDLGFVPNRRGNKAAANLRPIQQQELGPQVA